MGFPFQFSVPYPMATSIPEIPFIPNFCIYSCFPFLGNAWLCYYYGYMIYSLLFVLLWTTSVIYHYTKNKIINKIYKLFVYSIILYGGYIFFDKLFYISNLTEYIISFFIFVSFLFVVYLYLYGYLVNGYCFHKNKKVGEMYHAILHLISSLGNVLVLLL